MSPHAALLSASGLRPMSAFVVVGSVVLAVALWVVGSAAAGTAQQPDRTRLESSEPPAFSILDREGRPIARFVPRFDLELSPRSLWQAHTPWRMAEAISGVLGGVPAPEELLVAMLPDADANGVVRVQDWSLTPLQAQRVSEWIASGAGSGTGALEGIWLERVGTMTYRLAWRPEVLLDTGERKRHGVSQAWRWARRIADGLHACLYEMPLDPNLVSENEARRAREAIWKALMPTAFARPIRGIQPDLVVPLREELEAQGVASWQMRIAYARDRVYPHGEHELFGSWGFLGPEAREALPRDGLEAVCARALEDPRCAAFEHTPEVYRWDDDRPVRGTRANRYLGFTPASQPPAVRTTLDLGLQQTLGRELRATLERHQAALAMGIVVDVESGEVLALDSVEAYPIQPFAPIYHVFTTGSTFKMVTMATALEEGVVWPEKRFWVGDGQYRIVLPDGRPSGRVIREAEGALQGWDSAERFFAFSVNAALAQIGLLVDDEVFHGYLERLGYGRTPHTGLGPERAGNLPPTPWSYAWTHASIGFGHEFSTTLWIHAQALATILRGGVFRPLGLLHSVEQGDLSLEVPEPEGRRVYSYGTCETVREMMRLGAREGTGRDVRAAFVESLTTALGRPPNEFEFDLGTKTGTAQKVPTERCVHVELAELAERARWEREGLAPTPERLESLERLEKPHSHCYTSSICAFGRVQGERELMVLIVVEEPRGKERYGSKVAGPAAQRVLAEALGLTVNGEMPSFEVVPGFGAAPSPMDAAWTGGRR